MTFLFYLLLSVSLLLIFFLIFPFITVLLSLLAKERLKVKNNEELDYGCIITGYQNVEIALPLIDSFLKQDYKKYHIYLVADNCDLSNITFPLSEKLTILSPPAKLGSKVKSFIYGISNFKRKHDAVLILDPDNLGHPSFLKEINHYFQAGFLAVQGKRTAKNLDSVYACIDATGELYFNYTQKEVPYLLGSSANIAGSGMAVEYNLFNDYLNNPRIKDNLDKVIVAEDKILQNHLVGKGYRIAFAKKAVLYDEKVEKAEQVVRQRSRWLNSYFENVRFAGLLILQGLSKLDVNRFLFGLLTIFPPMFLFVLASVLFLFIDIVLFPKIGLLLLGAGIIFSLNFLLVLKVGRAPSEIWKNLIGIPAFVFYQIIALTKMKKANKDFLATKHTKVVTIDHLIAEDIDKEKKSD